MRFDIPRGTIFRIDEIDIGLYPDPHPFAAENREAIAANWLREKAAQPALFDGEVALLASLFWREGRLSGVAHLVRYSAFMYWRRLRPIASAEHIYAHAMPVTRDNALVAIRMSSSTVGAGLAYFAAGSFDASDFPDGKVDVPLNMVREVREETGLDIAMARTDACFHGLSLPTGTVLFRRCHLDEDAETIADRIERFVRDKHDPHGEIAGPVIIRDAADLPERLAQQMPALIAWHFRGK